MSILFAHLPLGLGLLRCVEDLAGANLVADVHLLGSDELDDLAASLAKSEVNTVVTSATGIPDALLELVDDMVGAAPLNKGDFVEELAITDVALAHQAFRLSGGWPEAVVLKGGRCRPSVALVKFLRTTTRSMTAIGHLAELVACEDQPVPLHVLCDATGTSRETTEDLMGELETIGLVEIGSGLARLAVPIAAEVLLPTSPARMRAARCLSDAWLKRDPLRAAVIAADLGEALDDHTRSSLVSALRSAEANRQLALWGRLSQALAQLPDIEEHVIGRLSSARLCLLRGRHADAVRLINSVATSDRCAAELEATAHAAAIFGFGGGNPVFAGRPVSLASVLPPMSGEVPYELDLFSGDEATRIRSEEGLNLGSMREVVNVAMEGFTHDYTILRRLSASRATVMNLVGYVLEVFLRCAEGQFGAARDALTVVAGERFDRIEGRFMQLAALLAASGTDVSQTRELLATMSPVPRGGAGSTLDATIRSRSELVVGRINAAWSLIAYPWEFALDRNLKGAEQLLAPDAISIAYWSANIERLQSPISEDLVAIVEALGSGEPDEAEAATEATEHSPYLQARMLCLAADLHRRHGADDTALTLLQRAASTFSALGAPVDLARALAQARRSKAPDVSHSLTMIASAPDTKQRLLRLVGLGLANAEIAADLNLSVSTVKRRISELLTETSLANRRQLAELARSLDTDGEDTIN